MLIWVRRVFREFIVFCFHLISKVLRQKPHLDGIENLKKLPTPVIIALTHDSYYEIPSLATVYYNLDPLPDFLIIGKDDFLSGRYLSLNFGKENKMLRFLMSLIDRTGLPKVIFKILNVTTIHRPFAEVYSRKKTIVKQEIRNQVNRIRGNIVRGISTVVFPEGTTWGFGGLKRIRSIVYQLVEKAERSFHQNIYILPVNIKVDRLIEGAKDVFIKIGDPVFLKGTKENFNKKLFKTMQKLHTITFSQIGALVIRRLAEIESKTKQKIVFPYEKFLEDTEWLIHELSNSVTRKLYPGIDINLLNKDYFYGKAKSFFDYCIHKKYLTIEHSSDGSEVYELRTDEILAQYPARVFRKKNPIGFHANMLLSLGSRKVKVLFDKNIKDIVFPAFN